MDKSGLTKQINAIIVHEAISPARRRLMSKKITEQQSQFLLSWKIDPPKTATIAWRFTNYIRQGNGAKSQGPTELDRVKQILGLRKKYVGRRGRLGGADTRIVVVLDVVPRDPKDVRRSPEDGGATHEAAAFSIFYEIMDTSGLPLPRRRVTHGYITNVHFSDEMNS